MASENEIIMAIESIIRVTGNYSNWTVGVTEDPLQRKTQHEAESKNTNCWKQWKADSETAARNVEKYFLAKGMKGGSGGGDKPTYVYIF